jgi:O-antigen ligase
MIAANPVLGVGLGAYGAAFPVYSKSDGSLRVPQSHNDYLQVVADCGIVGGAIAAWFLILLFKALFRGIHSAAGPDRDSRSISGLALGFGGGIFAILVHSLFDFNLQIPSNALLFLVLSAVTSQIGALVAVPTGVIATRPAPAESAVAFAGLRKRISI